MPLQKEWPKIHKKHYFWPIIKIMEIYRKEYVEQLLWWKDKHVIKILTGVRRSGKSTILNQFKKKLLQNGISKKQFFERNFNNQSLVESTTWQSLLKDILDTCKNRNTYYLFLDEIQEIKNFEKAIITLFEYKRKKFDIYLTGSNSHMFSSKLATLFTGRNTEIKIYPFSFKEYLEFAKLIGTLQEKGRYEVFEDYLVYGGIPEIFKVFDNKVEVKKRLASIVEDTIQKDIKNRYDVRTYHEFKRFTKFAFENNGNIFSTTSISNYLKSNNKFKTNHKTIDRYLLWLCEALLFYKVEYFRPKGKRILQVSSKYYCVDTGMRNTYDSFHSLTNRGIMLENVILIELYRRGYSVNVGKTHDNKEIDFVATRDKELIYIQVADKLDTDKIKKREYGNLLAIKDSYKKIVITSERIDFVDDNGIETINIINWLLSL